MRRRVENIPAVRCPLRSDIRKIGTIQRRLAWPLHKDDTLFQSGRPSGLNIYAFFCNLLVGSAFAHSSTEDYQPSSAFVVSDISSIIATARAQFSRSMNHLGWRKNWTASLHSLSVVWLAALSTFANLGRIDISFRQRSSR